jgi:hypothetical protein
LVNCSNYRIGACMQGTCPNDRPECCQECNLVDCCPDRDCSGPDNQTRYAAGYNSAAEYDWSVIPLQEAIKRIDAYKTMAIKYRNEFYAGIAQGGWDLLLRRGV